MIRTFRYLLLLSIPMLLTACSGVQVLRGQPNTATPPSALTVRGIWVQCDATNTPAEADALLNRIEQGNFDRIYFCVGGRKVLYRSDLLPPLPEVTPTYDPLAYTLEQAHARGIKVHAWWMPGRIMRKDSTIRAQHPDWDIARLNEIPDDFHWFDFSVPAARQFVVEVIAELAQNYPVDGVHLDYIRYPPPPPYSEFDVRPYFSPNAVPQTVQAVYQRLKTVRPNAELSAAVMANQGSSANHLQNWADWLDGEYIDYVIPMAYLDPVDFDRLAEYHREWRTLPHSERIIPGLKLFTRTDDDRNVPKTPDELLAQLAAVRRYGYHGFVLFDERNITENQLQTVAAFE